MTSGKARRSRPARDGRHLDQTLRTAAAAAREAGQVLMQGWGRAARPRVRFKSEDINLVTEFDGRSEAVIVGRLAAAFPDDAIVAEEGGRRRGRSGRVWYVDPLDGTTNFAHGLPLFAVSIGLCVDDRPVVGVVEAPALRWRYLARLGGEAKGNRRVLRVSPARRVGEALLVTGFPYVRNPATSNLPEFAAMTAVSQGVRRLGAAALDLCFVAAGWLDGYWERQLKPWDLAAGAAIVEAAGGRVSDPDGGPFRPETGAILASNGQIHDELLGILRGAGAATRA